ncbi:recombinase RecT [Halalkalibacterium halodurans]|uniref:RecT family recombinase n=1 Tax=Halalkalibacterium halodurans TaxID=86665 RepID=UPI002E1EA389|nr:recombinase RecT [Halalkalibacterium halodurans]
MSNVQLYTAEIQEAFKPEVLKVMRNTLAPTATDAEFVLFAHKAASYGLDPFKNEIFFIKYGQTARIQFAAEAYLAKAREKEGFQPPDTQMVHENDEFKVEMNPETKSLEVVKHEIGFPRGRIIGAYSIAYRDGYRPVTVIMDIEEVEHMFKGQNKDNWTKWTADMFGKHVQQRALKKQYGIEFDDETISNDEGAAAAAEQKRERKDVTPNEEPQPASSENKGDTEDLTAQIKANFKSLGITNAEQRGQFFEENGIKFKDPKSPTQAEMVAVVKVQEIKLKELFGTESDDLE